MNHGSTLGFSLGFSGLILRELHPAIQEEAGERTYSIALGSRYKATFPSKVYIEDNVGEHYRAYEGGLRTDFANWGVFSPSKRSLGSSRNARHPEPDMLNLPQSQSAAVNPTYP